MNAPFLYPGSTMTAARLIRLADAYRLTAIQCDTSRKPGDTDGPAPVRLLAIHAIELYLNAVAVHFGRSHSEVRGWQHDLGRRCAVALEAGIPFKRRTIEHLRELSLRREYLTMRYDPDAIKATQWTRLRATLNEIADKAKRYCDGERFPPLAASLIAAIDLAHPT